MHDLPSLTVSDAHYSLIVAAFPGANEAEKVTAYRAWLTNRLIERVESRLLNQIAAQREADIAAMRASLPPRADEPALPA